MTPKQLIDGLRYLAEQCPIDATVFRVPSAPSCTDHNMRLDVAPRDILDLLEYVKQLEQVEQCAHLVAVESSPWSNQP